MSVSEVKLELIIKMEFLEGKLLKRCKWLPNASEKEKMQTQYKKKKVTLPRDDKSIIRHQSEAGKTLSRCFNRTTFYVTQIHQWFEMQGIVPMVWPAQIADLNLIENLWETLDKAIKNTSIKNRDHLHQKLRKNKEKLVLASPRN